eukprot:1924312-Prymnesium_polylepis.2
MRDADGRAAAGRGPWSGRRLGKRTGSPIPEGTELSVCGVAAYGQGRGRRGGERAHSFAAAKEQRLAGLLGLGRPRAWRNGAPTRSSLFGILRSRTQSLASFS